MKKRVLITVGGTGGHIFPAVALAKQLQEAHIDLLFVGGGLSKNRCFQQSFPFLEVPCGTLPLTQPIKAIKNSCRIVKGIWESVGIIQNFDPDLVVGFGSYFTLPTLLASKLKSVPFILHEANRIPGKVNRLLSKHAVVTGVHFPDTVSHLRGKAIEVSVPLRDNYKLGTISREQAKALFQLNPKNPVCLIFGGSQGAKSMNDIVADAVVELGQPQLQLLHLTGDNASASQIAQKYHVHRLASAVKAFETQMNIAWAAADFVICRSGAGTIAEAIEFEVPSILIPYPHATDNHQESNADYMVETVRGGYKCVEKNLSSAILAQKLEELLSENNLTHMREAIHHYKQRPKPLELRDIVLRYL